MVSQYDPADSLLWEIFWSVSCLLQILSRLSDCRISSEQSFCSVFIRMTVMQMIKTTKQPVSKKEGSSSRKNCWSGRGVPQC